MCASYQSRYNCCTMICLFTKIMEDELSVQSSSAAAGQAICEAQLPGLLLFFWRLPCLSRRFGGERCTAGLAWATNSDTSRCHHGPAGSCNTNWHGIHLAPVLGLHSLV